jgi:hypothetical protein
VPRNRRLPAVLAAVIVGAAALATAGCGVGVDAATALQPPSGNGAQLNTGPLAARGVLLVTGAAPGTAALIGTFVNTGATDDAITGITITGGTGTPSATIRRAGLPASQIPLPGGRSVRSSVQVGYDPSARVEVTGLTVGDGRFVQVAVSYKVAGTADLTVMTVPAAGPYADLGPAPVLRGL